MAFKGLARFKFLRAASGAALLALSVGGCAEFRQYDNGVYTENTSLGPIPLSSKSGFKAGVANATEVDVLRASKDAGISQLADRAACIAQRNPATESGQRLAIADRLDSALARSNGEAKSISCPPEPEMIKKTKHAKHAPAAAVR